ncbi:MAG: DUF488 domain-containing protein [Rhizobiales bacterium]|nr:DUF488 domain-containing protein [Hyphomicrobiales bacterium]MBN9010425.1 DUF488 domain-containing protein [Hyphomicrobiales bacterium]
MNKPVGHILVKRVYAPPEAGDGQRVLVDRLWPRGLSKGEAHLDAWLKDVAPSPALRKWFGHDPTRFAKFTERYRGELDAHPEALAPLLDLVRKGRVTLLYGAHDEVHNQAVVLADYLAEAGKGGDGRH